MGKITANIAPPSPTYSISYFNKSDVFGIREKEMSAIIKTIFPNQAMWIATHLTALSAIIKTILPNQAMWIATHLTGGN